MSETKDNAKTSNQPAPGGTDQRQLRQIVDDRNMKVAYANYFRLQGTGEEVLIDLGVNSMSGGPGPAGQPDMVFQVGDRVVLNYFAAKRLAVSLSQLVRQYEDQFGEIELDIRKRQKK